MKNLMIYISPSGSFDNPRSDLAANDAGKLVKVQIENSIQLGWQEEDILLFTNFYYQYGNFKAKILEDVEFFDRKPQASKINAIIKLFENGLIKGKEIYWHHDLDAFQLEKITESELRLGKLDMALTNLGRKPGWNTGTIFFKKGSCDIFEKIRKIMYKDQTDAEWALYELVNRNISIKKRIKKLNKTYNFTPFNLKSSYKIAKKPLRIVHFHPLSGIPQLGVVSALKFYLGENELHKPLITKRLARIFKYHRIG